MVEDSECKRELRQLLVGHRHVWLESAFRRAHPREVDGVARLPVVLLQVAQVVGHHCHVGAPVLKTDEHPHSDFMHSRLPHTVVAVEPPFEDRLHALWMVDVVARLVVGFLEAYHAVESRLREPVVVVGLQRLHLD